MGFNHAISQRKFTDNENNNKQTHNLSCQYILDSGTSDGYPKQVLRIMMIGIKYFVEISRRSISYL